MEAWSNIVRLGNSPRAFQINDRTSLFFSNCMVIIEAIKCNHSCSNIPEYFHIIHSDDKKIVPADYITYLYMNSQNIPFLSFPYMELIIMLDEAKSIVTKIFRAIKGQRQHTHACTRSPHFLFE